MIDMTDSYTVDLEEVPLFFVRDKMDVRHGAYFNPNAILVEQIQRFSLEDGKWDCRKLGIPPVHGRVSYRGCYGSGVEGPANNEFSSNLTRLWSYAAPTWNVVRNLAENSAEILVSKDLDLPIPFFLGSPIKETRPTMLLGTFLRAISFVGQLPGVVSYIECDREMLCIPSNESLLALLIRKLRSKRDLIYALTQVRGEADIRRMYQDVEKLEQIALKSPIQSGLQLPAEAHFGKDHILGVIQLNSKMNTGDTEAQARFDAVLYLVDEPPTNTDVIQLSRTVRFNHPSGLQIRKCQLGEFVPTDMKYMD